MDSAFKDKLFTSFSELQIAIQEYEEKNVFNYINGHLETFWRKRIKNQIV